MTENSRHKTGEKVLPFKKEGEFFFRRGLAMLEKNRQLDAVMNFRRAVAKDIYNPEYAVSLAEALAGIGKFEESNRVIFSFFPNVNERPPECFFGLGCNFASMGDNTNAKACMEQYLAMESDGEFVSEACDVLDAIEAFEQAENRKQKKTELHAVKDPIPSTVDVLLAEDDDEKFGIKAIENMAAKDKKLVFLRNLLAIKYYMKKDVENARIQTEIVLKEEPDNIHAHCNNLMIAKQLRDRKTYTDEVDYILGYRTNDLNELNRIAVTLLDYAPPKAALAVLNHMYTLAPYDKRVMHKLALCNYALDDYKKSIELYDRIIKLDETDDVALFYKGVCLVASNGGIKRSGLSLEYEVPMDETVNRVARIKEYVKLSLDEQLEQWQNDASVKRLIIWGIRSSDVSIKRAMLTLLASLGDRKAELLIRDFLLIRGENNEIKREAFGLLAQIKAQEPYMAYINGELVESRVDRIEFMEHIPKIYRDILTNCLAAIDDVYETDALVYATHIWRNYIKANEGCLPSISRNQAEAMTVALEYCAVNLSGRDISKYELCAKYGISSARFEHAYAKFEQYAQAQNIGSEE